MSSTIFGIVGDVVWGRVASSIQWRKQDKRYEQLECGLLTDFRDQPRLSDCLEFGDLVRMGIVRYLYQSELGTSFLVIGFAYYFANLIVYLSL